MTSVLEIKFEIQPTLNIQLPKDSRVLEVQMRNGVPTMWVHCRPNNEQVPRHFICAKTSAQIIPEYLNYLGTLQIQNGLSIWHIFEEIILENNDQSKSETESAVLQSVAAGIPGTISASTDKLQSIQAAS